MYRLTPRMLQRLKGDLGKYHDLFDSNRCSGWELEELLVGAVKSDTQAQHHVQWQEAGHDDKADIVVRTNGARNSIQVKSGQIRAGRLILSGHRLGRFDGDLRRITDYLNAPSANIIAVPYRQTNDDAGRRHLYRVCYADRAVIAGIDAGAWRAHGKQYRQTNASGVEFSLRPSMSWQIWWSIPLNQIESTDEFAA